MLGAASISRTRCKVVSSSKFSAFALSVAEMLAKTFVEDRKVCRKRRKVCKVMFVVVNYKFYVSR